MASKVIEIILQATDKASKVIANLGKTSEKAANNIEQIDDASKDTSKDIDILGTAAKALGGALSVAVVVNAAKAAFELAELGAQSQRTEHAFEMISGGADEAGRRLDAMRTATRGAMSEQEMMASASRLMQMGLAKDATELENVTKMAVKLGTAMGNEAGASIENFSLMLANQSIMRLDSFGISSGKVRERIAELQKEVKGMTRETAFMTAVMEEGGKAMNRLGEDVEDDALAFEKLEASWMDLKVVAGEALAPALSKVVGGLADVTREVVEQRNQMEEYTRVLSEEVVQAAMSTAQVTADMTDEERMLAEASYILGDSMVNQADGLERLEKEYQTMIAVNKLSAGQMADYAAMEGETTIATDELTVAQNELATAASTVAKSFGEMEFDNESLWNLALASGASVEALSALALQLGIANQAEIQASIKSYELVEAFGAGTLSAKEYADQMARLASATSDADARLAAIEARGGVAGQGPRRYQHGTMNHPGGWGIVGDAGPEALWMPPGSQVHSNQSPVTQQVMNDQRSYRRTVNVGTELALALEANRAAQEQRTSANMLM